MMTFVKTMQETDLWRDWDIQLICTHINGSFATRLKVFVTALWSFVGQLAFDRPSVVHLQSAAYGSIVRKSILAWISILFRVPVVYHMHGADFDSFYARASKISQFAMRSTLEHVDAVIALGDEWAQRLQMIAPRANIVVVPNAVRPGLPVEQAAQGTVNVAFLGEICDRKGTFTLIDAWAAYAAEADPRTRAHLTIAGDGDVEGAQRRVVELGLTESVDVRGWMSSTDVEKLLAETQVLVLPSLDEGQPMAILEAMARGLCVVASSVGGIPEMVANQSGVLVQPDDVEQLAAAIQYVTENTEARATYGKNALQRIHERFDVDVISRRIDELYRSVTR
jgi:glycosyltransferase involved in cell wall biosynthesis